MEVRVLSWAILTSARGRNAVRQLARQAELPKMVRRIGGNVAGRFEAMTSHKLFAPSPLVIRKSETSAK